MIKRRAVFLDRDGTLNALVDRDGLLHTSPRYADQFRLLPDAVTAVKQLHSLGFLIFVVSNQPGIARGTLDPAESERMMNMLRIATPVIDEIMVCPHDESDKCPCRKPKAGMLINIATRWNIDLASSFMIGDSWKDVSAGRAAGCRTIYLGPPSYMRDTPDDVASSLMEAVTLIEKMEDDKPTFSSKFLADAGAIITRIDVVLLERMASLIATIRDRRGRLFFLGVGGGAAHASHAVNDFRKLAGIECYTPTDNVAELTARINDDGWDGSFAEWLKGSRLNAKDGIFVFSVGGGNVDKQVSMNIVKAINHAKGVGATVLGIVGRDGGYTAMHGDAVLVVPTVSPALVTPLTEAFQAVFWHLLVSHPLVAVKQAKWESVGNSL